MSDVAVQLQGVILEVTNNFPKGHYFIAFTGIWVLRNGILHDVFVLLQRKPFDKELIRLLIDGHLLIFSGILYLICYEGIKDQQPLAYIISILVSFFILGYCALIFKMLPATGMIVLNLIALVWLVIQYIALTH
jgi:hypothetical protein